MNLEFNVGLDIEEVQRWRDILPFSETDRAMFYQEEHVECEGTHDPASHYAARWCAKEAVVKAAWPFTQLSPRDVRIISPGREPPKAVVQDSSVNDLRIHLTMTHTSTVASAAAICIATRNKADP